MFQKRYKSSPVTTFLFEIRVPPQKYFSSDLIKAAILKKLLFN